MEIKVTEKQKSAAYPGDLFATAQQTVGFCYLAY
jgi:hypothetical protein